MNKKLIFLFLIGAALLQFACKKDGGDSGPPKVSNIRIVDSTMRDSFFTSAIPGTQIVIQGSNLDGVKAIYFNDTSAYFNPVYNTSSNIIVTVPYTAQTKATRPDVPSVIRIVTDHGTVEYAFELYLNGPYITSIAFDNTGKIVTLNGGNFQGIQKIVFPTAGKDTALSYTVNKDFNQIQAVVPSETALPDSVRVYCTYGVAAYTYPPPMAITSISNENAVEGTIITLNGTNFIAISQVTFPGGIAGTEVTPIDVNHVSVKVPAGVSSAGYLGITGALGTAASPQPFASYLTHPSPGYLSTFDVQYNADNTGFVGWTGGYTASPAANYPNATGGVAYIQQGSPMPGGSNPGSQGNPGFVQLNEVPWVTDKNEAVAGYSLKFEVYVAKPWSAGAVWIMMGGWYGWHNYMARYAPWETAPSGTYKPVGWQTVTIPLTQLVNVGAGNEWDLKSFPANAMPASKFSDYSSTALCFTIVNDQPSPTVEANSIDIAIDNVRIVKGQ